MVVAEAPQRDQGVGQRPPGAVLAVDRSAQVGQEAVHLHAGSRHVVRQRSAVSGRAERVVGDR